MSVARVDFAGGWRKSSRSYGAAACIEVAGQSPDHIRVRDSNDLQGPVLQFSQAGWTSFLGRIRNGKYSQN
jgi:hypothetical protein